MELRLRLTQLPRALTFRKGSARVFLVIAAPRHEGALSERFDALEQTGWARFFEQPRATSSP